MKRDNINYLVVGTVVLTALVMMLYVIYRMTGGVGEGDAYYIYYGNVGGLSEGTPVSYQGYKLGSVTTISPARHEGRTRYRVDIAIRDGWKVPADSVARVYSEGLLAETVINIEEGQSREYLSPGDELQGRQGVDVFAALSAIADDVGGLTRNSVRPLLDNLNDRISTLGDQVGERLPLIMDGMQALVVSLQDSADRLNRVLSGQNANRVERVMENTDQMSANLLKLSEGLVGMQAEAEKLLADSSGMVGDNREDIRMAIVALRQSLEEVAAYADGILHNMEGASRNMNEFSRQIRENPGLLLGGKAPREKGERGE